MRITKSILACLFFTTAIQCKEPINCEEPKGGYEQTECALLKLVESDKALNEVYKKLKASLGKDQAKLLVTAQKGWIQLRDNQCALEVFALRGTTGYNAEYSDCLTEMTKLRTKQLEATPTDSTME